MSAEFVHLHLHSQYSFLTGAVKIGGLPNRVKQHGMRAIALTDSANMFGALRHYNACRAAGVQPILGCELNVVRPGGALSHLVLLATNAVGYQNLVGLVSHGHLSAANDSAPSVTFEQVAARSKGLVALSGCLGGLVPQTILEYGPPRAHSSLSELRDAFEPGHVFVELQDHGFPEQSVLNGILTEAARDLELPLIATNDVHFVDKDDGLAHQYLECIRMGRTYEEAAPIHHGSAEMYLKSPTAMAELFHAHPAALSNTLKVAEMCSGLKLDLGEAHLPQFPVPQGFDAENYFRHVAREGLDVRFKILRRDPKLDEAAYRARLELELDVIARMKYPGYFLIVWDFIREAKARGIPVGPGRGSGAGSLVAYSLGITELDPIKYGLLFERFLNPERVSMPDFDVDFCMSRRDEVIQYVAEKYGVGSVGQIGTFQNLKARSVIKDVARAMGIPAPEAQRIASLVPPKGQGKMCTIDEALEVEPKLKQLTESDPRIKELVDLSRKLEGLTRHAGMHAAGIVISEGPLAEHVPCFKSDQAIVTQYDKDDIESVGLVKFDFLGLKTLTLIDIAVRLVNARPDRRGKPLDIMDLPLDDQETYALLSSGTTTGVFQLESSGMQDRILRPLKPDCFEDIVAAVALYRPGPLGTGMIEDFIGSKHGRKAVRKLHPLVDDVLAPTYGVPVYQEQVMQIAQLLSGYSLGEADLLRRAMGKKKLEEMNKQKASFIAGAEKRGVEGEKAKAIFEELEGFASYGFNKSHSVAYALVTYQSAWLKAHYPTEFFAAALTTDKDKVDKVVRLVAEARAWGVTVLSPDVNASETDFSVVYSNPLGDGSTKGTGKLKDRLGPRLRFGLGAVRGVGETALETMFDARKTGGPFRDFFDFATRVDAKRLNKGVLEALVQCGAFDTLLEPIGVTRARAYAAVDRALERSRSASRERESGQSTLFGAFDQARPKNGAGSLVLSEYPHATEWDRMELLKREKEALGCYVSGHPLFRYGTKVNRLGVTATTKVAGEAPWSPVSVAGMVENYQERIFKGGSGGRAAFFEIEDMVGRVKAKVRSDRIETYAHLLTGGQPLVVSGKVSFPMTDEEVDDTPRDPTILVDGVELLSDKALSQTKAVSIKLEADRTARKDLELLRDLLQASPGSCPVELVLELADGAQAVLELDGTRITPNDALLGGLERAFGGTVADLR
jgi:DNA polymerase III subunit alpha